MQPRLDRLPEVTRRIGDLQREVKSAQAVYDALQLKFQDATISKNTALSDVTITQPADPTVFTSKPSVALNLAIGMLVGLALALGTVFVVEFFDDRFRTEADVAQRLGSARAGRDSQLRRTRDAQGRRLGQAALGRSVLSARRGAALFIERAAPRHHLHEPRSRRRQIDDRRQHGAQSCADESARADRRRRPAAPERAYQAIPDATKAVCRTCSSAWPNSKTRSSRPNTPAFRC